MDTGPFVTENASFRRERLRKKTQQNSVCYQNILMTLSLNFSLESRDGCTRIPPLPCSFEALSGRGHTDILVVVSIQPDALEDMTN